MAEKEDFGGKSLLVFLEHRKQFMRIWRWAAGRDHVLFLSFQQRESLWSFVYPYEEEESFKNSYHSII